MRMKSRKLLHFSAAALCMLLLLLFSGTKFVSAAPTEAASQAIAHITDNAGLLSDSEKTELEDMCTSYGKDAGIGIFILTHNDSSAVDGEVYIEDYYDSQLYGTHTDSVILLVDMANRDVVLEGYGTAETYINSKRGDVIIQDISPDLTDEQYFKAFETYIESSAAYMKDDSELNYDYDYSYNSQNSGNSSNYDNSYNYDNSGNYYSSGNDGYLDAASILTNPWFQLIAALAIGAIAVGIMAFNAGGKMTAGGNTYIDTNHSGLIGRRDDYIRTTVTRVRRPQNNNTNHGGGFNAGGFGGGMSGGGHSHSTSRGSF